MKQQPILIIFGIQHPEETWYRQTYLTYAVPPPPWELQKLFFNKIQQ